MLFQHNSYFKIGQYGISLVNEMNKCEFNRQIVSRACVKTANKKFDTYSARKLFILLGLTLIDKKYNVLNTQDSKFC